VLEGAAVREVSTNVNRIYGMDLERCILGVFGALLAIVPTAAYVRCRSFRK